MHTWVAGTPAALVLALVPSLVQAQQMRLTPQIGLGTLEQAAPDSAFETAALARLGAVKSAATGFTGEMLLLRKDRGPHAGRYAVFVTAPAGSGRHIFGVAQAFPAVQSYQLVGAEKLGALPTVDVLGVHYIKVRPEKAAAFDTFVARTSSTRPSAISARTCASSTTRTRPVDTSRSSRSRGRLETSTGRTGRTPTTSRPRSRRR